MFLRSEKETYPGLKTLKYDDIENEDERTITMAMENLAQFIVRSLPLGDADAKEAIEKIIEANQAAIRCVKNHGIVQSKRLSDRTETEINYELS